MYRSIQPISHMIWHRKEQFALHRDIYDYWTMFAVEAGSFWYRIGEIEGEAEAGEIVVCPPRIFFERKVVSPLTFHFIHFALKEADAEVNTQAERNQRGEKGVVEPNRMHYYYGGKYSVSDHVRLRSTYALLHKLTARSEKKYTEQKRHLLRDLWFLCMLVREEDANERDSLIAPDDSMYQAKAVIHTHAYEMFSMQSLAESLQLTPVQLTRKFRSAFGVTPLDYLTELRLKRASELLEETTLSLEQIAPQCGYDSGFYLSRIFGRKRGISPSAYRKRYKV